MPVPSRAGVCDLVFQAFCRGFEVMDTFHNSAKVHQYIRDRINPYAEEVWLLSLNSLLQPINVSLVFRGTAHFCPVHCRDIFRQAIFDNAVSFILIHNHPGGDPQPSYQDIQFTKRLFKLAQMMEIPLLDHVIVTTDCYYSLADVGLIKTRKK